MAKERKMERRFQCLKCYKTFKDEQKALDCCKSIIQSWYTNYEKWGRHNWLIGR